MGGGEGGGELGRGGDDMVLDIVKSIGVTCAVLVCFVLYLCIFDLK